MANILITGGAGFIGSNLCQHLLNDSPENHIYCLDDLTIGTDQNIKQLQTYDNFEFIEHDVTAPFKSKIKFDYIYHLACPASPAHYGGDNAVKTTLTSVLGTKNMLDLANQNDAPILFSSTSEVYGEPLVHPQSESYWGNVNPIGIRSCYDEGKRCAETLAFDYHRIYKTKIKVIRIFNTYGPNMDVNDGRVVSNTIVSALKNEDITIYGSGEQTRAFMYIDDLVDGIIKMANSRPDFYGPVNLGNPSERTINDLVEKIHSLIETQSKIIYLPALSDDPSRRKPNIELANKELNWGYKFLHIYKGLKKTIDYFKEVV